MFGSKNFMIVLLLLSVGMVVGCIEAARPAQPTARQEQARISADAANGLRLNANAERANILARHQLTGDPSLLGYIILLNEAGQPILYEGVKGKVTTSGSRLTAPDQIIQGTQGAEPNTRHVVRAPSDIGTYDTGNAVFIFYWNTDGVYRQWSGNYLYSTQPIRTRVEPLVINVQGQQASPVQPAAATVPAPR